MRYFWLISHMIWWHYATCCPTASNCSSQDDIEPNIQQIWFHHLFPIEVDFLKIFTTVNGPQDNPVPASESWVVAIKTCNGAFVEWYKLSLKISYCGFLEGRHPMKLLLSLSYIQGWWNIYGQKRNTWSRCSWTVAASTGLWISHIPSLSPNI